MTRRLGAGAPFADFSGAVVAAACEEEEEGTVLLSSSRARGVPRDREDREREGVQSSRPGR
ncbi:hypothetical protein GCM10009600_06370 [Oerskovia paurometabola]